MKIAVVIPNWNGVDFIGDCLKSLEKQSLKSEVIVVDNGSVDGSVEYIKKNFPKVTLLEFDDNAGFAGGVNRGIRYALKHSKDYILLLNNDAVADKYWIKNLTEEAKNHPEAGIITSKILLSDKKHIDSTGDFYTTWALPFPRGRNQVDKGQFDNLQEVFGASGGASLYRAELFNKIGLFDEDFFAYYEDVDISFRAQLAGYKVRFQPTAIVYHGLSKTSAKMGDFTRFHSSKNFILLNARNMPMGLWFRYFPLFFLQWCRLLIGAVAHRKLGVFIKGTWAAIKLRGNTIKARQRNKNLQTVSNKYIKSILTHSRPPKIPKL